MYYYDLQFRNTRSIKVEEIITLYHDKEFTHSEFVELVKQLRKDAYASQIGKRCKYEAFNYVVEKLLEFGFKKKVVFDF